jgi:hypothetical protein
MKTNGLRGEESSLESLVSERDPYDGNLDQASPRGRPLQRDSIEIQRTLNASNLSPNGGSGTQSQHRWKDQQRAGPTADRNRWPSRQTVRHLDDAEPISAVEAPNENTSGPSHPPIPRFQNPAALDSFGSEGENACPSQISVDKHAVDEIWARHRAESSREPFRFVRLNVRSDGRLIRLTQWTCPIALPIWKGQGLGEAARFRPFKLGERIESIFDARCAAAQTRIRQYPSKD